MRLEIIWGCCIKWRVEESDGVRVWTVAQSLLNSFNLERGLRLCARKSVLQQLVSATEHWILKRSKEVS
jgi:hypothetical protein